MIPNQKTERIVLFVEILNDKLKYLEQEVIEQKLKTEEFTDLLEDGFVQASRALTKERLEYIASLLKNSLTDEELEHIEKKKLLSLLGELNDAEIIWLQSYCFMIRSFGSDKYKAFYEKHQTVLEPVRVRIGSSRRKQLTKMLFKKVYKDNLIKLGLIKEKYKSIKKGEIPEFDEKTGRLKTSGLTSTTLGKLLIKCIDLNEFSEMEDE